MRDLILFFAVLALGDGCRSAPYLQTDNQGEVAALGVADPVGNGNVVVISDIDDTIKVSHVLGVTEGVATAFRTSASFSGMAALYQEIKNSYESLGKHVFFYYVSNAPTIIMSASHRKFIEDGGFPSGTFKLASIGEQNHKVTVIKEILEEMKPEAAIFVGDNGEKDVYVYDEVVKGGIAANPAVSMYIRMAYLVPPGAQSDQRVGKPLQNNQIGFASAGEIAIDLFDKGVLDEPAVAKVMEATIDPNFSAEREPLMDSFTNLPYWYDCTGHLIRILPLNLFQTPKIDHNRVFTERCSQKPKSKEDILRGNSR